MNKDYYNCRFAFDPENTRKRKELYIECGADDMSYHKHRDCSEDCYLLKEQELKEKKKCQH